MYSSEKLADYIEDSNLKKTDIVNKLGISRPTLYRMIEPGNDKYVTLDRLMAISELSPLDIHDYFDNIPNTHSSTNSSSMVEEPKANYMDVKNNYLLTLLENLENTRIASSIKHEVTSLINTQKDLVTDNVKYLDDLKYLYSK